MSNYIIFNGNRELKEHVQKVCEHGEEYRRKHMAPDPLLVRMDQGQRNAIEYMVQEYAKHGVLPFDNGLDDFIELELTDDYEGNASAFCYQEDAAVYGPYDGVESHILTQGFANHVNERQAVEYLKKLPETSKKAATVIFVPETCEGSMNTLIRKVKDAVPNLIDLNQPMIRSESGIYLPKTTQSTDKTDILLFPRDQRMAN